MNINGLRLDERGRVILCGDKICCANLERCGDGRYKLTDDDGNFCYITAQEAALMEAGIRACDNQPIVKEQLILG